MLTQGSILTEYSTILTYSVVKGIIMNYKINIFPLAEVVSAYEITRQTVWRCADEHNIIVVILDGNCTFTITNKTYKVTKGDVVFIPMGEEYIRRPIENSSCRFAYIHFKTNSLVEKVSEDSFKNALSNLEKEYYKKQEEFSELYLPQLTTFNDDFDSVTDLLNSVLKEFCQGNVVDSFSAKLSFLKILLKMQKNVLSKFFISSRIPELSSGQHSSVVQGAIEYIRDNYENKISLEDLQKNANVSAQHLIRLFRKEVNMTPVEYINHVKILHAIDLLRASNLTVEEISYKLNFTSASYFIRVFKKHNGNTPNEERQRIRNFDNRKE